MPLVEIDDIELNKLREEVAASKPYRQVWGKVLAGRQKLDALKLVKAEFPDLPLPELDTAEAASKPILDELAKIRQEHEEYKKAQEEKEAERAQASAQEKVSRTIAAAHRKLKADGWDEEGVKQIEELMQERGIGDYDVAAAYVKAQIPTPSPLINGYEGKDLNWFNPGDDAPDHKLLMENPAKFKSDMVKKFFSDKQAGNLSAWAA